MQDKNGKLLRVGDKVTIECTVDSITRITGDDEEYCDVLINGVFPIKHPKSFSALSVRIEQIELVDQRGKDF